MYLCRESLGFLWKVSSSFLDFCKSVERRPSLNPEFLSRSRPPLLMKLRDRDKMLILLPHLESETHSTYHMGLLWRLVKLIQEKQKSTQVIPHRKRRPAPKLPRCYLNKRVHSHHSARVVQTSQWWPFLFSGLPCRDINLIFSHPEVNSISPPTL